MNKSLEINDLSLKELDSNELVNIEGGSILGSILLGLAVGLVIAWLT